MARRVRGRAVRGIRVLRRETLHQGKIIRLIREVLMANGRTMVRDTIKHPGAVVVVPLLDDGRIVFVRQYRRAVERWLLELPAGTLDHRELPHRCAKRELEEETGWTATRFRRIAQYYAAPGFVSEQMTMFLATGLSRVPTHPEPDELVRPVILSLRGALAKIQSGAICDAKTIIGLLLVRDRLRR